VDDGSPDGCPAICDEYAALDDRFIVIHQENAGTAHARDTGIKQAQGGFLAFVDSDDWLEQNALELLCAKQRETGADMVIGGIKKIYKSRTRCYLFPQGKFNHADDVLIYYFLNPCSGLWCKLYKRPLFVDYFVPATNIGEDGIVNVQIHSKLKNIQIVDKYVYNYDRRTEGIILRSRKKHANNNFYADYPEIACRLWTENFLKKTDSSPFVRKAFACNMIREGIVPYLREHPCAKKETVSLFYNRYYCMCPYLGRIPFAFRIIIPLLYHCNPLGKCYILILNAAIWMYKKVFGY
jgi:glycosyltransferase involved in cell wall biosynthesis